MTFYCSNYASFNVCYTVKLARAKLPANAGNFNCSSQVNRLHTQFTCVKCSLLVKTGKFTCFYAARTPRKIHANCMQSHAILPENNGYFTGNFTCGTHANLIATSMQNCLLLQVKIHAICRQKHWNRKWKNPPNAGKYNCKRRQKYPQLYKNYLQLQAIRYRNAGKITCKLKVS